MTSLTHTCDMTHDSLTRVTWLMTHSHVWHDSWLTHTCGRTRAWVCRYSLICMTWLTHTCDPWSRGCVTVWDIYSDSSCSNMSNPVVIWVINMCDRTIGDLVARDYREMYRSLFHIHRSLFIYRGYFSYIYVSFHMSISRNEVISLRVIAICTGIFSYT